MKFGIALGSNLGDRLRNLQGAMHQLLSDPSIHLRAAAPVYETDPVDCPPGSEAFFNTVVEVEADFAPLSFLERLRQIEESLGRPNAHKHHAPRTVDLDMLYADEIELNHPDLILPHPRLHHRRFVLQPLADIRPGLVLPRQSKSVAELLAVLDPPEPPLRLAVREWWAGSSRRASGE